MRSALPDATDTKRRTHKDPPLRFSTPPPNTEGETPIIPDKARAADYFLPLLLSPMDEPNAAAASRS